MIWKIILKKMRAKASKPNWVKDVQGIKAKTNIKNQTFFKSCHEGLIIAPIFRNRNTTTQSFHCVTSICFRSFIKSSKNNFQLENSGIINWFAKKYLFIKKRKIKPPNNGAIDIKRFPIKGNLEFE